MLELKNLSKAFDGKQVLQRLSLRVAPGEILGLCGANGAGKTTTLRIVMGLVDPDGGEVLWNGASLDQQQTRLGYLPDERSLLPNLTPYDQLVLLARVRGAGEDDADHAARHWLSEVELDARPDELIGQLSLGGYQRVQLAAALLHDPEVLLLDEPFSAVDAAGVELFGRLLRQRADAGVPVLLSSHQVDVIEQVCDSIGVLNAGRMTMTGSLASLREIHDSTRLSITLSEAPSAGWSATLPHATEINEDGAQVTLTAPDASKRNEIIQAAMEHGLVDSFTKALRPFSEIVREASAASLPRRAAPDSLEEMAMVRAAVTEEIPGAGRRYRAET